MAAELKTKAQRAGRPSREIVNETLRRGLEARRAWAQRRSFEVRARDLGDLKPGISPDNIAGLIEQVEGRFTGDPRGRGPAARCLLSKGGAARRVSRAWLEAVLSAPDLVRFA